MSALPCDAMQCKTFPRPPRAVIRASFPDGVVMNLCDGHEGIYIQYPGVKVEPLEAA